MTISGLVIAFNAPAKEYEQSLCSLRSHPSIELGEVAGNKCAIVLESASKQHDQELWAWVQSLPGVVDLQIAFVGFDEASDEGAPEEQGGLAAVSSSGPGL